MTRLHLRDVALAFRQPLVTAAGAFSTRRSVIVGFERDGVVGWGEAPTFPSGGWGTIDEAWEALSRCDPEGESEMPLASAALQAARHDHSARGAGTPLCAALGGSVHPVSARLAVGLVATPSDLVARVASLVAVGAAAVKLKITPGGDTDHIAAVRQAFPDLAISVDANGAYSNASDPVFVELDRLGVDLIEQPLPPGDLAGCALLRDRLSARVCLDEDLRSEADAARVLDAGAADVLSLKLMRLGYETTLAILARCRSAGIAVKAGGTFDSIVGRHHVLAFATLDGVIDAEAGPPAGYLIDPLGEYPGFIDGTITPVDAPGIGPGPDPTRLAGATVRSLVIGDQP